MRYSKKNISIGFLLLFLTISSAVAGQDALQASMEKGKALYSDFCVNCHMENGAGVPFTFPPLANSDYLMEKREASIRALKYGLQGAISVNGENYNGYMAPLGLEDAEVADIMNYITNSWGNTNETLFTQEEVTGIPEDQ